MLLRPARSPRRSPTPRTPARLAAGLLLSAALAAAPAAAAGAPPRLDLRLTAVSAPASAVAGQQLAVRALASARGAKAPRTGAALYLSADAERSKDDVRVAIAGRLPALAKGRSRTLSLGVTVPAALAGKTVRVIACIDDPGKVRERNERNDCRVAAAPTAITATLDATATPAARIATDLAAGKLTPAVALEYRVFALFADPKLPARYAGAAGAAEDDGAMREAASAWPTLTPAIRKAIGKYFVPPPVAQALEQDPAALVQAKPAKGSGKGKRSADEEFPDDEEQPAKEVCVTHYTEVRTWDSVSAAGGKVRLHWERSRPDYGTIAKGLVGDVTRAYARYKLMLGSEPLSDGAIGCYHGEDGALDIYLTDVQSKAGVTVPSAQSNTYDAQCEGYPGFIAADPQATFPIGFTVAHELFHAFQMAYRYKAGCKDGAWLDEGSATWAAHLIYPDLNSEHLFDFDLEFPKDTIEREYHSWVVFLWMEHRFGDAAIRTAYHALPKADSTTAVDQGIGGFRKQFLDFAKAGWNQDPEAPFVSWDHLDTTPRVTDAFPAGPPVPVHLFLDGMKQRTAYAEYSLYPLWRDYKRYEITDEKLRLITFKNPLASNPDMKVGAYLTLGNGSVRWEDWSGKEQVRMCRDEAEQDVRSIILVYANANPVGDANPAAHRPLKGTPELGLKDSCEEELPWHYEVLWGQLTSHIDGYRPGDAKDGLCVLDGFSTHDVVDFTAAADGEGYNPDANTISAGSDGTLSGDFGIIAQTPTRTHRLDGCMGWDDSTTKRQCSAFHADQMGPFAVSFALSAASKNAQTATLKWGIPPAIAGFFDADDSVCNVGTLDHWVSDQTDLLESEVLLTQLRSREPFTVTLTGDTSWTGPADLGDRGTLTYHFEAKMRLQRVAADGSPL